MRIEVLNGNEFTINEKLDNFTIKSKPSSNVGFYGVCHDAGNMQLFVQFKNGSSYIYSGITDKTLADLINCESIGKFISSQIVNKFPSIKIAEVLVTPVFNDNYKADKYEISGLSINASGEIEEPTF